MSDFRYAQGNIAGVELNVNGDPCKCLIVDGANLQSRRWVNQRFAASGHIFTQGFNNENVGQKFGLKFDYIPVTMLQAIIAAINNAIDSVEAFTISLEDDFQTVDTSCQIDGSDWLTYPDQVSNSQMFKDVSMRFITTS